MHFFFEQKTAYEVSRSLVVSEMSIRDREHLEQPKTGVATSFGQLNPDRGAVFHYSLINIRRLDGQNAISILHGYSIT